MLIAYLFAARSLMLATIDAGYVVVQFLLFGAIFFWLGSATLYLAMQPLAVRGCILYR